MHLQNSPLTEKKSTRTNPTDLRPWAKQHRYRWRWEESRSIGEDEPFLVEVVCKYGLIYPKGSDVLLAYANHGIKRHLANIGLEHYQTDGDAEVFRFPADRLDEVAAILKPRKRRTLDPYRARVISGLETVPRSERARIARIDAKSR